MLYYADFDGGHMEIGNVSIITVLLCTFFPLALANTAMPKINLNGSRSSILKQNKMAEKEGLSRIKDAKQREKFRQAGLLVPIPTNEGIRPAMGYERALVRPETARFLRDLGHKFHKK